MGRGPRPPDGALRRLRRRLACVLLWPCALCPLVALTGCSGLGRDRSLAGADPLLGGTGVSPSPVAAAPATGTPVAAAANPPSGKPLPPLPAPSSLTSTAALAAGPAPTLEANDLRIADPSGRAAPGGKPTPSRPATSGDLTARPDVAPVANVFAPSPGFQATSYERTQELLRSRGVTWQRLETYGEQGEWKFSCSVPNRLNRNISRTYEARASAPVAAIQAVLEQMDQER